ncbi:MAG: energy-coupling factor ABC transporter permease [Acidimicrobiales bacterium]
MHIPDGWVDLPTAAGAAALGAAAVVVAGRRAAARLKERATTLPAVLAAYLLVAQLPALPIGVGASAHLVGTGLITVLVGPGIAMVCVATVVVVQAFVLADGGVTALGLNFLANGAGPALAAAAVLGLGRHWAGGGSRRLPALAGLAAGIGTMAAAATVAAELTIGGTDIIPPGTVAAVIGGAHLVIAVVEGLLTAAVVSVVARLRPDLLAAGQGWRGRGAGRRPSASAGTTSGVAAEVRPRGPVSGARAPDPSCGEGGS